MPNVEKINRNSVHENTSIDTVLIASSALNLVIKNGTQYAKGAAPTSPNPKLTGNIQPNKSRLTWLEGYSKCNQFVGDALTNAGFVMPTNQMADGSLHYKSAESLINQSEYFTKLKQFETIQIGDLFVKDYGYKQGESGAHVEIITGIKSGKLTLAGAHSQGAYLSEINFNPIKLNYNNTQQCWFVGQDKIYILRAKKNI